MIKLYYLPGFFVTKRMVSGAFFMLRLSLLNLWRLKGSGRKAGYRPVFQRPARRYSLPEVARGIEQKPSSLKYLRRTLYCNPGAPAIIAMADRLGAGELPEREYAAVAFEFVKRSISIEILPLDEAETTLERGTGTCLHKLSLLIALCRTTGIKARYKLYVLSSADNLDQALGNDPASQKRYDELGRLLFHGEAEILLDNAWVTCSPGLSDERQASLNLPITRFGEQALGVWYSAEPGSVTTVESIPYGMNILMKAAARMAPAVIDRANLSLAEQCRRGRAILEDAGEAAYDAMARRLARQSSPEIIMSERQEIRFEK
ncbi:MAG: transglutaminase family protein [Dehalococcoidaceae bacterium]|nr:transglutaminase family protein [Dehalococcoidaceae bacterium]